MQPLSKNFGIWYNAHVGIRPIITVKKDNTPKVLITKCEEVKEINQEIKDLAKNLLDTALSQTDPEAAGLAAPQIGVSKRVCLVRKFTIDPNDPKVEVIKNFILINPKITSRSSSTDIRYEACLSIPEIFGKVQRNKQCKVEALNENGEKVKIKAKGLFARIIQHEVDHLDGILFTSKTIGDIKTEDELNQMIEASKISE